MTTETAANTPAAAASARRRPRRWLRGLLALLFGLVVAGFAAELLVLAVLGEQVKFPRHVVEAPWGLRYNDPGSSYRHKSPDVNVHFTINAQGMRADHDYTYDKPPGVKRILSLGDSFTIGYEVEAGETFSSVMERALNAKGDGDRVEVLNCGVSGFGNAEECLYVERELLRYDPDVVVVSYFPNDLEDNIRSGLFTVKDGKAVPLAETYVPAGKLANFLNSFWIFNFLSERSNAFAFAKERITAAAKRDMIAANEKNFANAQTNASPPAEAGGSIGADDSANQLVAAIFERMYEKLSEKKIPLVIQSIAGQEASAPDGLIEGFPKRLFPAERPGLAFVPTIELLRPHVGKELLYWTRSHWHWTPFSHRLAGEALAREIVAHGFLK